VFLVPLNLRAGQRCLFGSCEYKIPCKSFSCSSIDFGVTLLQFLLTFFAALFHYAFHSQDTLYLMRFFSSLILVRRIRRHEEREVQHLTMSVAAPTSLNVLWFPSSLMGRDATDHDDDDDPDDKSDDD